MIKYIGSKRTLVPLLGAVVGALAPGGTVIDLFSGTSRVGHALKQAGHRVLANDHNAYAAALATCYVQADAEDWLADATKLVAELNRLPGSPGHFTDTWCVRSRFFQPKNGERIEAIRDTIAAKALPPELEAVLIVALMEAADRVDSTTGLQMAFLKEWAPRSFNDLELRVPRLLPRAPAGKGAAFQLDAIDAIERLEGDVGYIDPPYNQHKYLGNYHVWETLVRWDRPEVYGIACKRVDCRTRTSPFNARREAADALAGVIAGCRARHLVVSFSDEGFHARERIEAMLAARGDVHVVERDFKRYVGAQIGIYNPRGEKVGAVGHLRNKERVYVVTPDRTALARVRAGLDALGPTEAPTPAPAPVWGNLAGHVPTDGPG